MIKACFALMQFDQHIRAAGDQMGFRIFLQQSNRLLDAVGHKPKHVAQSLVADTGGGGGLNGISVTGLTGHDGSPYRSPGVFAGAMR